MNSIRPAVALFLIGMLSIILILGVLAFQRSVESKNAKAQTNSATLVAEDKVIEVAPANFANQSYVDNVSKADSSPKTNNIVVEGHATYKFMSKSNIPAVAVVSKQDVLNMQESARIRQLQQQLGSTLNQAVSNQ